MGKARKLASFGESQFFAVDTASRSSTVFPEGSIIYDTTSNKTYYSDGSTQGGLRIQNIAANGDIEIGGKLIPSSTQTLNLGTTGAMLKNVMLNKT